MGDRFVGVLCDGYIVNDAVVVDDVVIDVVDDGIFCHRRPDLHEVLLHDFVDEDVDCHVCIHRLIDELIDVENIHCLRWSRFFGRSHCLMWCSNCDCGIAVAQFHRLAWGID